MSAAKDIIKIVPTIQAASLVGTSYKLAKKKKKKSSDFLSGGINLIGGTALIQAESQIIGGMD